MKTNNLIFVRILLVFTVTLASSTHSGDAMTPVSKLIIDTDAGGDDAVAIILAAEAERLDNGSKILGITCVNGNTYVDNVALNVLKTLKIVDRLDIPVYKGATRPLLTPDKKDNYYGRDGFKNIDYPDPPPISLIRKEHAVFAMINFVKENPGEITLVALGPLTNIALAIRLYPTFLDELQQLIIMGGSIEGPGIANPRIEFNFLVDPIANFVVFNSSISKPLTLVSYETADKSCFDLRIQNSSNESNNEIIWLIDSINDAFPDPEEFWYCTDMIAMAVALTSGSIVTNSTTYYSDAIYEGTKTAGMIVVDWKNMTGNSANTNLIHDINVEDCKQLCLRYIRTL